MSNADTRFDYRRDRPNALARFGRFGSWSLKLHSDLIVGATVVAIGTTAVYLLMRPEAYSASSSILVESRVTATPQPDLVTLATGLFIRNQLQILRSETILKRVIQELDLTRDRDFAPSSGGAAQANIPPFETPAPDGNEDNSRAMHVALDALQRRLTVEQIGDSSAIEIRVTAHDPQLAAKIANRISSIYLDDPTIVNVTTTQRPAGTAGNSVRLLSAASEPLNSDGPGAPALLALAGLGGLLTGVALAFGHDLFRGKICKPETLWAACGVHCFGILPVIEAQRSPRNKWYRKPQDGMNVPSGVVERVPQLEWSVQRPCSLFAHALRRARVALCSDAAPDQTTIVGITSATPREGKTMVAANLARVAAMDGKRVLLIDAVPYNFQLTKLLAPQAACRLRAKNGGAQPVEVVLRDRLTSMHFLPGYSCAPAGAARVISGALFAAIRKFYELIIVDLPPLLPVSDVHELAPLLDKVLFVVEWGRWTDGDLRSALATCPAALREKMIGAVLNRANPSVLQRFSEDTQLAPGSAYPDYVNDRLLYLAPHSYELFASHEMHYEKPRKTSLLHLWQTPKPRESTPGVVRGNNDTARG